MGSQMFVVKCYLLSSLLALGSAAENPQTATANGSGVPPVRNYNWSNEGEEEPIPNFSDWEMEEHTNSHQGGGKNAHLPPPPPYQMAVQPSGEGTENNNNNSSATPPHQQQQSEAQDLELALRLSAQLHEKEQLAGEEEKRMVEAAKLASQKDQEEGFSPEVERWLREEAELHKHQTGGGSDNAHVRQLKAMLGDGAMTPEEFERKQLEMLLRNEGILVREEEKVVHPEGKGKAKVKDWGEGPSQWKGGAAHAEAVPAGGAPKLAETRGGAGARSSRGLVHSQNGATHQALSKVPTQGRAQNGKKEWNFWDAYQTESERESNDPENEAQLVRKNRGQRKTEAQNRGVLAVASGGKTDYDFFNAYQTDLDGTQSESDFARKGNSSRGINSPNVPRVDGHMSAHKTRELAPKKPPIPQQTRAIPTVSTKEGAHPHNPQSQLTKLNNEQMGQQNKQTKGTKETSPKGSHTLAKSASFGQPEHDYHSPKLASPVKPVKQTNHLDKPERELLQKANSVQMRGTKEQIPLEGIRGSGRLREAVPLNPKPMPLNRWLQQHSDTELLDDKRSRRKNQFVKVGRVFAAPSESGHNSEGEHSAEAGGTSGSSEAPEHRVQQHQVLPKIGPEQELSQPGSESAKLAKQQSMDKRRQEAAADAYARLKQKMMENGHHISDSDDSSDSEHYPNGGIGMIPPRPEIPFKHGERKKRGHSRKGNGSDKVREPRVILNVHIHSQERNNDPAVPSAGVSVPYPPSYVPYAQPVPVDHAGNPIPLVRPTFYDSPVEGTGPPAGYPNAKDDAMSESEQLNELKRAMELSLQMERNEQREREERERKDAEYAAQLQQEEYMALAQHNESPSPKHNGVQGSGLGLEQQHWVPSLQQGQIVHESRQIPAAQAQQPGPGGVKYHLGQAWHSLQKSMRGGIEYGQQKRRGAESESVPNCSEEPAHTFEDAVEETHQYIFGGYQPQHQSDEPVHHT